MANPYQITCHLCREIFFYNEFESHFIGRHFDLLCSFCGAPHSTKELLRLHFSQHHSQCRLCPYSSVSVGSMKSHLSDQHESIGLSKSPFFRMPSFGHSFVTPVVALPQSKEDYHLLDTSNFRNLFPAVPSDKA
jgi:hypothetical protein